MLFSSLWFLISIFNDTKIFKKYIKFAIECT